ncbi:MAG: DMT family transporter [Rhodobacteraceae bacterium]|jgi:drug/metabolite transporter (DMT)-like permease|uniref:DMT family transporter n=1 Tax=Albidovulum sp. TaxID=1872424 RepID=UPI001D1DE633|nr:DMT family transporter [uncultured Defluviimonas sp.]MCB2125953.1 DMT family transporter [Paracoccaceae bacterium]MCC0069992.1 DMT family transporter [Paracoccaceae bacterium]
MTTLADPARESRTLVAAGLIFVYAMVIGFTDNFVRVIAEDAGLWQFHAVRMVMAIAILLVLAPFFGLRLRPARPGAVALRSAVHGMAMMIYFGCLAFLPVATVAAGLFTAPIFTLLISRFAYGQRIGPFRILAVAVGFLGVILVLKPGQGGDLGLATVLPVVAGVLYALGNIATRTWCAGERAEVMLAGFFLALGTFGLIGMAILAFWQPAVPSGVEGFVLRGPAWPTGRFLFWTFVQAAGSLLGVGMMIRAYQIADAGRVAIFEYVILPASAFWTWALWGETLGPLAVAGILLIFAAGFIIALRGR